MGFSYYTFASSIFLIVCLVVYLLPRMIAYVCGHNNTMAILAANLFLGWTTIGWVVTLIWSLTCNVRKEERVG